MSVSIKPQKLKEFCRYTKRGRKVKIKKIYRPNSYKERTCMDMFCDKFFGGEYGGKYEIISRIAKEKKQIY